MISIPLYIFLFLYLIFLCIFLVFSAVNFYHVISTASFTTVSFTMSVVVFILTILTLFITWHYIADIDWRQSLIVFDSNWFN
ncbi:MAG: hypothetical protein HYV41_01810 [Candidatus Magasanikbacteria bacterium]|nr:hypothetical protein [Candidatus Magasanikbacteria bacterium]